MSVLGIKNILNVDDFYERYYNEWKAGIITEKSVDDLFSVLSGLGIESSIFGSVSYNMECIIAYMLRYKYSKTQSINWIEPIRNNNFELRAWIDTDPKVVEYGCRDDQIKRYVDTALSVIFRSKNKKIRDCISIEEEQNILKEFSIENLADIDFVEDYLEKYARTNKVKRYLQKKGIYYGRRYVI